jgi:methionyl-tRNA formyltransferase
VFRAVVFAYSEVGLRCLRVLLDHRVDIPLVFTHEDSATETPWFGSVARLARERGIEVVMPRDPNAEEWVRRLVALSPQYILSFYYRSMLDERLLACARWGALNMHGSLLPKYRGRAPVNWAILHGETTTGATLHYMVSKPDAGAIVAQESVAIGIDDTALTVSLAVAEAAAKLLVRTLPTLAAGAPPGRPMDLSRGSYFGRRRPEDGRIDWAWPAERVHALIRAVAPPFPGAFSDVGSQRLLIGGSRWTGTTTPRPENAPCLYAREGALVLDCSDGLQLAITRLALDGRPIDAPGFARLYGRAALCLDSTVSKGIPHHEEAAHPRG